MDGLEQYLAGAGSDGPARRDFDAHLARCEACRAELREFQAVSGLFTNLRPAEPVEPPPGFYFRLRARLGSAPAPFSFWPFFSLEPAFGKRLAFASLMILGVLGTYLISQDSYMISPPNPETVMAIESNETDRETMLLTLTSYEP